MVSVFTMRVVGYSALFLGLFCFCVCQYSDYSEYEVFEDRIMPETGDEGVLVTSGDIDDRLILVAFRSPPVDYENEINNQNLDANSVDRGNFPFQPTTDINSPVITIEMLAEKIQSLDSKIKYQEDKIAHLETSYKALEEKMDFVEQQIKTNNVIFFNVKEDEHESHKITLQKVLSILNRLMKVRVNLKDISFALRKECNSTQIRPILVSFNNFDTKMKVLAAKNRLTHSNIGVVGDYSEKVAKKRIALVPYMQSARSQGHRAFILYDKLVVNGVKKTLEELQGGNVGRENQTEDPQESSEHHAASVEDPKEQVEELEPLGDYD